MSHDEGVATEQRDIPRHARGRHESLGIAFAPCVDVSGIFSRYTGHVGIVAANSQGTKITDRLLDSPVHLGIGCRQLRDLLRPLLQSFVMPRVAEQRATAVLRLAWHVAANDWFPEQATVPGFTGLQCHPEENLTVCVFGFGPAVSYGEPQTADECIVLIS